MVKELQIISDIQSCTTSLLALSRWKEYCVVCGFEVVEIKAEELLELNLSKEDSFDLEQQGVVSVLELQRTVFLCHDNSNYVSFFAMHFSSEQERLLFEVVGRILFKKETQLQLKFEQVAKKTDFPIVMLNERLEVLFASPSIEYIFNDNTAEIARKGLDSYFTVDSSSRWKSAFLITHNLIECGVTPIAPLYLDLELAVTPVVTIDVRLQTIFDADNSFCCFYLEITDNTEQKQLGRAVSMLNHELSVKWEHSVYLFENAVDPIIIHDRAGRIVEVNNTTCSKFKQPKADVLKINLFDLVSGLQKGFFDDENFAEKLKLTIEVVFIDDLDNRYYLELKTKQIYYKDQSLFMSFLRDITPRKLAQIELRESEARHKMLIEEIPCGIFLVQNKEVVFLNKIAANLLGLASKNSSSNQYLLSNLVTPAWRRLILRLEESPVYEPFEMRIKDADGGYIYLRLTVANTRFGGADARIIMSVDITEQKMAQEELLKAKEMAEESDRLKSNFLANISHEVRTPVNAINGFSLLLEHDHDMPDELRIQYLKIITQNSHQLMDTISNIIEVSEIQAGLYELLPYECSVIAFFDDLHHEFLEKVTHIHFFMNPTNDFNIQTIRFDGQRVKQLLSLLLNNAVKFTHKGFVELSYSVSPDSLEIMIKDTGVGIAKEKMNDIFKLFIQGEAKSDTRRYGGIGLGLFLVKRLVELLGGSIKAKSEVRVGTSFYVWLPIETSWVEDEPPTETKNQIDWNEVHVLVIEDTIANIVYLEEVFSSIGAKVGKACSGEEAIRYATANLDVDIVLLDIQLPDTTGFELVHIIKELIQVPVVAQTAFALMSDKKRVLDGGFDGYLAKPIDPDDIIRVCEDLLAK